MKTKRATIQRLRMRLSDVAVERTELEDKLEQAYAYADQIAAESCGFAFDVGLAWAQQHREREFQRIGVKIP